MASPICRGRSPEIEPGSTLGIIPARIGSTRFPAKVLAIVAGKPLVQWVWEAARQSTALDRLIIATDSREVEAVAKAFGAETRLTGEFPNGTTRVAHVARDFDSEFIVNLQGDEPLTKKGDVDALVGMLKADARFGMTTLAWKCHDTATAGKPDIVKVAVSRSQEALYFSRHPIGSLQEGFYWRHIGMYGFRRSVLFDYVGWPVSPLETAERLEQLRALDNGIRIGVVEVKGPRIAVDLREDVRLVETELGNGNG